MCVCTHIHCVLQETVLVYVYSLGLIIKVPCSMHTHICICVCVCVCVCQSLSHVQLFVTPRTVAHQAALSMEFSKQEHWSGLPFTSPYIYEQMKQLTHFITFLSDATPFHVDSYSYMKLYTYKHMHAHTHTNTYLHKPMHSDTLTEFPYILIVYGYGSCRMIWELDLFSSTHIHNISHYVKNICFCLQLKILI